MDRQEDKEKAFRLELQSLAIGTVKKMGKNATMQEVGFFIEDLSSAFERRLVDKTLSEKNRTKLNDAIASLEDFRILFNMSSDGNLQLWHPDNIAMFASDTFRRKGAPSLHAKLGDILPMPAAKSPVAATDEILKAAYDLCKEDGEMGDRKTAQLKVQALQDFYNDATYAFHQYNSGDMLPPNKPSRGVA